MRKLLLLLVVVLVYNCDNKEKNKEKKQEVVKLKPVKATKLILPNHTLWKFNRLEFSQDHLDEKIYKLTRTVVDDSAYGIINEIPVDKGENYRISILVKSGEIGNLFGLRLMGKYPNRIDAVYNLKRGVVKGVESSGDFHSGKSTIISLNDGWYKCVITCKLNTNMANIIIGPTSGLGKTRAWEARTNDLCDSYIIPTSLTLEKLSK